MKVFVSSTFKDMHAERDMLQFDVLPEIEEFISDYSEELTFIDLRWGINTQSLEEDESAHKILSVCIDEIDNSKPYFIAFLGERYGWVPDKKLIESSIKQKNPEVSYLAESEKSVTALEIEYALAQKEFADRCLFYFRKPLPIEKISPEYRNIYCGEGEEQKRRLDALKSKIVNSGVKYSYYSADWDEEKNCVTGLDELKKQIISDLKELIIKDYGEKKQFPWQEKEIREAEFFFKRKLNHFSARTKLCDEITEEILSVSSNLIVINGEYGLGKSTLMAKLAAKAREANAHVLPIACGLGNNTSNDMDVWRQIAFCLEELLDLPHKDEELFVYKPSKLPTFKWIQYITELLYDCSKKFSNPLVVLIDDVDKLSYFGDFEDFFKRLLVKLPEKIVFVLSCVKGFEIPARLKDKIKYRTYTLKELNRDEKELVLNNLELRYQKELPLEVKSKLLSMTQSNNPLYLFMMYHRMLMLDSEDFKEISRLGDGMKGQVEYMLRLIEDAPGDIDGVADMIMEEAASRINKEVCSEMLKLMALTRRGLRDNDFKHIFKKRNEANNREFSMTDFYRLKKYMRPYLFERNDGRYDFTYENFRSGILKNLSQGEQKQLNEEVFALLESLPDKDLAHRDEYVWFAWKCDKKLELLMRIGTRTEEWWLFIYKDAIAKGLHDICMEDKGEWLISLLKDFTEQYGSNRWLSVGVDLLFDIICIDFSLYFKSTEEIKILVDIREQAMEIAEDIAKKYGTEKSIDNLKKLPYLIGCDFEQCQMYDKALGYYFKTLEIYDSWGPHNNEYEKVYNQIGNVYRSLGNYDKAWKYYSKVIEHYERLGKEGIIFAVCNDLIINYEKAAEFWKEWGKQDKVVEFENKIKSIKGLQEKITKDSDVVNNLISPLYLIIDEFNELMDKAAEHKNNGNNDEAIKCYEKAYELLENEIKGWNKTEDLITLAGLYDQLAADSEDIGNKLIYQDCLRSSQKIKESITKEDDDGEWFNNLGTKWHKVKVE